MNHLQTCPAANTTAGHCTCFPQAAGIQYTPTSDVMGASVPYEIMEAARIQAKREVEILQRRVREQRRELKNIGRAHQGTLQVLRLELIETDRWRKSWQETAKLNGWIAEELRQARGWSLGKYMEWVGGLKWRE